tara:strand:- start:1291 stop:2184 length:894 start_codon:yes stop_codon:yes gene_type:complete
MNKNLITLLKFILAIAVFYYLFKNNHIDISFISALKNNFTLNFLLFSLILFTLILGTIRWLIILRNSKVKIKFFEVFKIIYICSFFNNFMFGNIGGDALRILYVVKISKKNKLKNGFTIFVDRVFGLMGLFCLGLFSYLLILVNNNQYLIIFYIFCLILIILFCFFLLRFIFKKNEKINKLIKFLSLNKNLFFSCIIISIGLFFTVHLSIFLISSQIFLFKINLNEIFFANFISSLAGALPLTPGGIGLSEASFVFTNNNILNIYIDNLANIIIYYRLLIFIFSIPSLYFFFNYKKF